MPIPGYSTSFDGVDEYIDITSSLTTLTSTAVGTWSAWLKRDDFSATGAIIAFGSTTTRVIQITSVTDGTLQAVAITPGSTIAWNLSTDAAVIVAGVWTHVALVHNGTEPLIYVDGVAVAQTFAASADKTTWFSTAVGLTTGSIGITYYNSNFINIMNGSIAHASLWNTNFTAGEITELYNSGNPMDLTAHSKVANLSFWGRDERSTDGSYSYLLDGVDEYINIDATQTATASQTVGTIDMWVKPVDATPAASEVIMAFGDTNADEFLDCLHTTAGLLVTQVKLAGVTKWQLTTDAAAFTDGTWTHFALVQNGTSPVFYIDGVAVAQTFTVTTDKTVWFSDLTGLDNGRLGDFNRGSNGETNHYNGNMDNVGFWNVAMDQTEITELYNAGQPLNSTTHSQVANLTSYYKMGENDEFQGYSQYGMKFKTDEVIDIPFPTSDLETTIVGSFGGWFKSNAGSVPISFGDASANTQIMMQFLTADTNILRVFAVNAGVQKIDWRTDAGWAIDEWVHAVVVQNGTSPVLYINGVAVAQSDNASNDLTFWFNDFTAGHIDNYTLGANAINPQAFFNGSVDDCGVFKTNLTATEVEEWYNGGAPYDLTTHSQTANLVMFHRMGDKAVWDGTNFTISDQKGTNHGTSDNMDKTNLVTGKSGGWTIKDSDSTNDGIGWNLEREDRVSGAGSVYTQPDFSGNADDGQLTNMQLDSIAPDAPHTV